VIEDSNMIESVQYSGKKLEIVPGIESSGQGEAIASGVREKALLVSKATL
jgi:hypothetical protein